MGNIPKEVGNYGFHHDRYGNWIRVVEKEGDYGRFLNIESGITTAGYKEDGTIETDTKTKAWFKVPMDQELIEQLSNFLLKAAESFDKFVTDEPAPVELKAKM